MPIKTQSAKAKGRALQKHVVSVLLKYFPTLKEDDVVSRPMGSGGTDLMLSPLAQKAIKLSIECKNTAGTPSLSQVKQSTANRYEDTLPVVVWKPKGAKYDDSLLICKLEDFLEWQK